MKHEAEIIKAGTWLYDGEVEKPVRIIRQNWDYYYEEGYSHGLPNLNTDGYAFYVVYGAPFSPEPCNRKLMTDYFSRSRTCTSLEEAIELAQTTLGNAITWDQLPGGEI